MVSYQEEDSDGPDYSFWRHRLLPIVRVLMLLLATVFVLLSVWLETGSRYDSPSSFAENIAMYTVQINPHMNLSDSHTAVPDIVSFGLWKHCFGYIGAFRCLDQNLLYTLDANETLFAAIGNSTSKLSDASTAANYSNLVIALISSVVLGCTFCFSLWASQQITMLYIYVSAGLNLICVALVVLLFGWTFHNYSNQISQACYNIGSDNCIGYTMRLEIIFMIVSMACGAVSLILWTCVPAYDIKRKRQQVELNSERSEALKIARDPSSAKRKTQTVNRTSIASEGIYEADYNGDWIVDDKSKLKQTPDDESTHTATTDEPLFKPFKRAARNNVNASNSQRKKPQTPVISTAIIARPQTPQEDSDKKHSPVYELEQLRQNHRRYSELRSSFQPIINRTGLHPPPAVAQQKQKGPTMMLMDNDDDLAPPELPFAREKRRLSHGSGNTFGQILDSGGETSPGYDRRDSRISYDYDSSAQSSPGYPPSGNRRDSSGSYGLGRSQYTATMEDRGFSMTPQTHTPVPGYHPLNNKAITDDRIKSYLGRQ